MEPLSSLSLNDMSWLSFLGTSAWPSDAKDELACSPALVFSAAFEDIIEVLKLRLMEKTKWRKVIKVCAEFGIERSSVSSREPH